MARSGLRASRGRAASVRPLHDQAAEHRPERHEEERDGDVRGHRLASLAGRERADHQRARGRLHEARADALQHAPRDHLHRSRGRRAHDARRGEEGDARDERRHLPDQVAHPAAERHERREREQVARHDPVLADRVHPERGAHPRQRHAHHGHVHEDHRQAAGHRREHQPAARLRAVVRVVRGHRLAFHGLSAPRPARWAAAAPR
jgi:hypothetical protein